MLPLLILPMLTGCWKSVTVIDTSCNWYRPVCLSRSDSTGTINQVLRNEVAFEVLCPAKAKAVVCAQ
jgi:hypothetical protein